MGSIVQGLFGELVKIFSFILWCIGISTVVKYVWAVMEGCKDIASFSAINAVCLIIIIILVNSFIALKAIKLKRTYDTYCKEFNEYAPECRE